MCIRTVVMLIKTFLSVIMRYTCTILRGSRKFCQRGPILTGFFFFFFFFISGERIRITLKAGHHRPASETSFKWRSASEPMMAGLVAL